MSELKVGDTVQYYGLMNPLSDYIGTAKVKMIAPMHSGGENMIWLEGVASAWHPDAVVKVEEEKEPLIQNQGVASRKHGLFSPE